ncbi:hypothetical protein CEXT_279981 [Caerostris extrusa]|uniref:Uncharacterized protein n=1 Tax=Caerostris extrusa TaxID=172846 RepID=A0AAV4PR67_CAEEX|nr:hypothetical protein CEXT_279981 [Caerostris extrusa]
MRAQFFFLIDSVAGLVKDSETCCTNETNYRIRFVSLLSWNKSGTKPGFTISWETDSMPCPAEFNYRRASMAQESSDANRKCTEKGIFRLQSSSATTASLKTGALLTSLGGLS